MSLAALNFLIRQATFCESYADRLARRNAVLLGIYHQLSGSHWSKLGVLADEVVAFRSAWRQYRYTDQLPEGSEIQRAIFSAAKILDKLPPSTSRGLHAALKNTKPHFSIAQFSDS